jgi:hypothetical protein
MSQCKNLAQDEWANSMQNQVDTFQPNDINEISFCTRHPDPDWLRFVATTNQWRIGELAMQCVYRTTKPRPIEPGDKTRTYK